jgi:hypothetical protein
VVEVTLRADKTHRQGADRVLNLFIGEMQSLDFTGEEIVEAVIERCDADFLDYYKSFRTNAKHWRNI